MIRRKEIKQLRLQLEKLEEENRRLSEELTGLHTEEGLPVSLSALFKAMDINGLGLIIKTDDSPAVWLSDKARELLGIRSPNPVSIDMLLSAVPAEDRFRLEKAFADAQSQGRKTELEFRVRAEADSRDARMVSFHLSPFGSAMNQVSHPVIATVSDTGRWDKLRRDLSRAKEKSEEAERSKSQMLSGIAREIRTPMNAILGYSELLNIGNLSWEKRREYIKTIRNQGINLLKLIDDLAEIARLSSGSVVLRKSPCHVGMMLREITHSFRQQKLLYNREIPEIKIVSPEENDISIFIDAGRLQQLIVNLVSHMMDQADKGFVELSCRLVPDSRIEFAVRLMSGGMQKDQQQKAGARPSEEESAAFRFEGPGIELSLVRHLVRFLGGKMWAGTGEQGNAWYFSLPYEQVPDQFHDVVTEAESALPAYNWKDRVILIAEDDEVNYRFLEAVLQNTEAQLLHVHNGLQAVELCRSTIRIDLVLMDIILPEMNGFEAARQIRSFNPDIPIIAQTAVRYDEEAERYRQAGINDHIVKPIEIKKFLEKIDRYLNA